MNCGFFMKNCRTWSNKEIRKIAGHLGHLDSIINVSGWKDEDKEGHFYRSYFSCNKYIISNFEKDSERGAVEKNSVFIDLEEKVSNEFKHKFDLVFNHTIIEHIYNPFNTLDNLFDLSRNYILCVSPWKQKLHFSPGNYADYLRLSPFFFRRWAKENSLKVIYESVTPSYYLEIYYVVLLAKNTDLHENILDLEKLNNKLGCDNFSVLIRSILLKLYNKMLKW